MVTNFTFPGTLPAKQNANTRQIRVLQDNVEIMLDQPSRMFNSGDVVDISDEAYANLSADAFTNGVIEDVA